MQYSKYIILSCPRMKMHWNSQQEVKEQISLHVTIFI